MCDVEYDLHPCDSECRGQDLNLHSLNGNQALNLARLPISPPRRVKHYDIRAGGRVMVRREKPIRCNGWAFSPNNPGAPG